MKYKDFKENVDVFGIVFSCGACLSFIWFWLFVWDNASDLGGDGRIGCSIVGWLCLSIAVFLIIVKNNSVEWYKTIYKKEPDTRKEFKILIDDKALDSMTLKELTELRKCEDFSKSEMAIINDHITCNLAD